MIRRLIDRIRDDEDFAETVETGMVAALIVLLCIAVYLGKALLSSPVSLF